MELKPGYKRTEVGVIPEGWDVSKLGELASFRTGPFGSTLHKSDYTDDGVPVINPMHIVESRLVPTRTMTIRENAARQLSEFRLRAGDIIIGRRGDMGRCAVVEESHSGWLCGTGSMIIRCGQGVSSEFLQRILSSPMAIAAIEDASVGSTMINLNQGVLARLRVQCPPLYEQRAIAAALSDVDALLGALDQLIAKKRDLKQVAMQQLLTGQRRLPGFPGGWEVRRLGEIGSFSKGRGLAKSDLSLAGSMPAIPYTAIYTDFDEVVDVSKIKQFASTREITVINSPHVLIASSSNMLENIGKATAFDDDSEVAVGGDIILYKTTANVRFVSYLLSTRPHRKRIVFLSQGSTIRHVYASTLKAYEIALPSLAEQTAIAAVLSDMDAEIAALEQRRDKTRALKQGMMQELLTGRTRLV